MSLGPKRPHGSVVRFLRVLIIIVIVRLVS
jgi:hypothetical protein